MKRARRMASDYNQLIERLKQKKYTRLVAPLKTLISQADFNKIITYLTVRDNSLVKNLEPGEAYRLDKKITRLPRAVTFLRAKKGELLCLLETKSKSKNGKRKLPTAEGVVKKGKPAWEIGGDTETEYFNLVAKLKNLEDFSDLREEIDYTQQFSSPYIQKYEAGPRFKEKMSIYAPKARCDLSVYLKRHQKEWSEKKKNTLVEQLLQGIKVIHEKGDVHGDIKSENILVTKMDSLVITDFGLIRKEHEGVITGDGVPAYDSPEIAYYLRGREDQTEHQSFLAYQYVEKYFLDTVPSEREMPAQFGIPRKPNDIWAIGVIAYEIYYGCMPTLGDIEKVKAHPVLNGLLAPDYRNRFTIDEAITAHQKVTAQLKEDEPDRKRMCRR